MQSASQCPVCECRRMAWFDGTLTSFHYAKDTQYLGLCQPDCLEQPTSPNPQQTMTTASIQLIENKAQAMVGRTYNFKGDDTKHLIEDYVLRNNRLIISSDTRKFNFEAKNALKLLEAFTPYEVPATPTLPLPADKEPKPLAIDLVIPAENKATELMEGVKKMAAGYSSEPTQTPDPSTLYAQLTPIVTEYDKHVRRLSNYQDAMDSHRAIYLHQNEDELDYEFAQEIYGIALQRTQQRILDLKSEFMQAVQTFTQQPDEAL